ncbi:MAG TPA: hypothetical protein VN822_11450 [Candidatus Acidoferrales bacterium]|nr:hypothetical protein [Candidatus Acidoferrales bacterium]
MAHPAHAQLSALEKSAFAAPSWSLPRHRAESEAVFFGFFDRAAQEKFGISREQCEASSS